MKRSRGAQELANIVAGGVNQVEIADACMVSKTAVSRWLSGEHLPSAENRAVIKRRFKVELGAWVSAELVAAAQAAPVESHETAELAYRSVLQRAETLQRLADSAVAVLQDQNATPDDRRLANERLKGLRLAQSALKQYGNMTGETRELSDAQIVKSPRFARLATTIENAICPFTKEQIEKLDGEARVAAEARRDALLAYGQALSDFDLKGR